ncbi:long-chain acyl-CoA synthetase [Paraoerskovia marina]|uniref:Long-chain acyl-CoA synthetase n=1 Tax=Paraoerskovia marina TaxID=545619 RepID=A0A1H1M8D5_9CELL|nr:AMP-binding protein [Paraoerskovia marina]SDR82802.1 long-chain acyl-CoA synthetase [Paraoerskovia marina]
MTTSPDRPWLAHYPAGVPAEVEVPDEDVHAGLRDAAARWPEHVALDFFGKATTYAELDAAVDRAASALLELGVRPGDRVSLVLPNCTAHVVAFYATLRVGAVAVEHNPTHTAEQLGDQMVTTGSTVALVWTVALDAVLGVRHRTDVAHVVAVDMAQDLPLAKRLALRLPVARARRLRAAMQATVPAGTPRWETLTRAAAPLPADHPRPAASDTALLLFTGGTTGTPKAAELTHRNLVANSTQGIAWAGFAPGAEVVYGALPFFHAFGLTLCLTLTARIGATLVIFPTFDVDAVVDAQRRRPATFVPGVATMFDRLATAAEQQPPRADGTPFFSTARISIGGAMPISPTTAARWESATGGLLIEGYGMTETSPISIGNPCSAERRPGTLGLPFPSTEIRIVPQGAAGTDDEVAPDETGVRRGELLVRGPQVFAGYWENPEETAQVLTSDGWIRTGDVVTMSPEGVVTLVDRVKEMIVTNGFKVFPSQVEDVLRAFPGVREAAVVGLPDQRSGEHVAAALVVDGGTLPTLEAIRAHCEAVLARYALPREIVIVPELPRSQIGKVLRRVLRDDLMARAN